MSFLSPGGTSRLPGEVERPCAAVKALMLDSPIDPLAFAGELPNELPAIAVRGAIPRDVSVTQVFRSRNTQIEIEPEPKAPRRRPWGPRLLGLVFMLVAFVVGMVVGSALLYLYGF